MYFQPKAVTQASLLILDKRNKPIIVPLKGNCTLGREYDEANCDILLHSPIVSRRQGEFVYDDSDGSYYYIDNNSTNGTYINGERLQPYNDRGSKAFKLTDGDILRVDRRTLNNPHPDAVLMIFSKSFDLNEQWTEYNFSTKSEISISRGEENDLRLENLMVSQKHAVLSISDNNLTLRDNNSTNGVSVNGKEIETVTVYDHDVIQIANTTLIILGKKLLYNVPKKEAEEKGLLNVAIVRKTVQFGKKTLLKDINFEVKNNDFVLILGGSGAGKTTLVRAEYRSGMKISSYVMANVRWQFLLCLMESLIIFVLCIIFIDFNSDGIIMWAYLEYFLSIFLMTFGASVMGIMVSSIAGNPTTAMTIMPFVLILQLIMSGVLFELDGVSKIIAYITFSKWGMSAFGSIANMNSDALTLKLVDEVPELGPMLTPRPESMIDEAYNHEASNLLIAWAACLIITVVCIAVSIISLKLKNRDS